MEGEIARLESNHEELLSHQSTLEKQLKGKEKHVEDLQTAIRACEAALQAAGVEIHHPKRLT